MLDDYTEVDVGVLCLDLLGYFLAVGGVQVVGGPSYYVTTHPLLIFITDSLKYNYVLLIMYAYHVVTAGCSLLVAAVQSGAASL